MGGSNINNGDITDVDTGDVDAGGGASAVNSQIIDAVKQSTDFVYASPPNDLAPGHGTGTVYANTVAYPKVSQAAAFAVQDATDYLRNITAMSTAAQGVIFSMMVKNKEQAPLYIPILQQVQAAVTAAQNNLKDVGTSSAQILKDFEA